MSGTASRTEPRVLTVSPSARVLVLAVCLELVSLTTHAATPLDRLLCSSDVSVVLAGLAVDDEQVALDDLLGSIDLLDLGPLDAVVDVDGFHRFADGEQLLSFDTTVSLPGGAVAGPGDVVRFDGKTYTVEFEVVGHGLDPSINVDAVTVFGETDLLLSFEITTIVDGGITVAREDLVRFGGDGVELFFDGSVAGIGGEFNLDAAHYVECNGHLLLSFDGSGVVGGVSFDDEDVLDFDPASGEWTLIYDGSAKHPGWSPGDLDALFAMVVDADSDGLCTPLDCDDMVATCLEDCSTDVDLDSLADCADECLDADGDHYGSAGGAGDACDGPDCDDANADTHPGAIEVNDGADNQCPGDWGYGVEDEITGGADFIDADRPSEVCWPAQPGAELYQVARSVSPAFPPGCVGTVTSSNCWIDPGEPGSGEVFHYLVRALTPHQGSWGQRSSGVERTNICE